MTPRISIWLPVHTLTVEPDGPVAGAVGSSRQVPASGGAGAGVDAGELAAGVRGGDARVAGLAGDPDVAGLVGV